MELRTYLGKKDDSVRESGSKLLPTLKVETPILFSAISYEC